MARHGGERFDAAVATCLAPAFAAADADATRFAQLFRSAYVSSFALAALAVLASLTGLVLSPDWKPVLVAGEFLAIVMILVSLRAGRRGRWHRRWLDSRLLAERLRCLAISAQLGDLELHRGQEGGAAWVGADARRVARALGLPAAIADARYLEATRRNLLRLLDGQIGYLEREARRMHLLEHRLHRVGTLLFMLTATLCAGFAAVEAVEALGYVGPLPDGARLGATVASAALPALGASIYGIRMQGDFAGTAERNESLADQLVRLRALAAEEEPSFDTVGRLSRRVSELLTQAVTRWFHAYLARPLSLPG